MATTLNDYKIEATLGKGTFGTVYLVRRRRDLKPFVIKEQSFSPANEVSFKRIIEEVRCLQTMRHPNIVAYYGGWNEGNHSYILMEYATKGTLKDLLKKRIVPLIEQDALYLFSQVTLGVHHIHSHRILHRDLKPENIMLTGKQGDIVKIGDFGVSKNLGEVTTACRAGTYHYMAPEIFMNQAYEYKCDIWSMGVILYEMFTKELPFLGEAAAELAEKVCKMKPRPFNRPISEKAVTIISKLLRKDFAQRPSTKDLLQCPHLVPYIIRVVMNLGRSTNVAARDPKNFNTEMFLNYIKSRASQ